MKSDFSKKYREYFLKFGTNTRGFKPGNISREGHYTWYIVKEGHRFREELISAIHDCVENRHFDILVDSENNSHEKTIKFLSILSDENNPKYKKLRDIGLYDEEDILNYLSDSTRVNVKSKNTEDWKIFDKTNEVYYEYKEFYIEGIQIYIKIVFGERFLWVDIHGDEEKDGF